MEIVSAFLSFEAYAISLHGMHWMISPLIPMTKWLMGRYDLTTDNVIRHYDVTGKACPKYYVENEAAWEQFKSDLVDYIETNGIAKTEEIQ